MVYSCESPFPAALYLRLLCDFSTVTLVSSWEFFTTLNFEWDVIRGRRPYRWTIWVCCLFSSQRIASLHAIGLLLYPRGDAFGRNSQHDWLQYHNTNALSSEFRVPRRVR